MLQQPQWHIVPVGGVRIRAAVDHPAPLPHPLHQEHIVVVDMRAHIAAPGSKAHHHVVHPPGRQEAEMLQQRPHVGIPLVHVLHQQRPVMVRHAGKLGLVKRSGAQRPLVGGRIMAHQPSQRPLLARQPRQILRLDGRLEIGKRPANQHRPLLPIVTQEALGRHAQGERPFGRIDFQRRQCRRRRLGHRRIILCRNHRKHFILPADMRARVLPLYRASAQTSAQAPRTNLCSNRPPRSRSPRPRHKPPPGLWPSRLGNSSSPLVHPGVFKRIGTRICKYTVRSCPGSHRRLHVRFRNPAMSTPRSAQKPADIRRIT